MKSDGGYQISLKQIDTGGIVLEYRTLQNLGPFVISTLQSALLRENKVKRKCNVNDQNYFEKLFFGPPEDGDPRQWSRVPLWKRGY